MIEKIKNLTPGAIQIEGVNTNLASKYTIRELRVVYLLGRRLTELKLENLLNWSAVCISLTACNWFSVFHYTFAYFPSLF